MRINVLIGILGLILDISGAWLLANGLVRKTAADIKMEAASCWGMNYALYVSIIKQRIEARFGFGLMAMGFFLQAFSYLGYKGNMIYLHWHLLIALELIIIIVLNACISLYKIFKSREVIKGLALERVKTKKEDQTQLFHIDDLKKYCKLACIKFNSNDTYDSIEAQLLKKLKI